MRPAVANAASPHLPQVLMVITFITYASLMPIMLGSNTGEAFGPLTPWVSVCAMEGFAAVAASMGMSAAGLRPILMGRRLGVDSRYLGSLCALIFKGPKAVASPPSVLLHTACTRLLHTAFDFPMLPLPPCLMTG